MQIEGEESGFKGVIVVRDVPIESTSTKLGKTILRITGVERGLGGFAVRAFLYHNQFIPGSLTNMDRFSRENPDYLGELYVYATTSPTVPKEEQGELAGVIPPPLQLKPYNTFIDISEAECQIENLQGFVDIALVLIGQDNQTISSDYFRFTGMSIQRNRVSN